MELVSVIIPPSHLNLNYAWHETAHTIMGFTITQIHNSEFACVIGYKGWGVIEWGNATTR